MIFLKFPKLSLSSAHEFVTTRFPKEKPKFRRDTKPFVISYLLNYIYRRSFTVLKLFFFFILKKNQWTAYDKPKFEVGRDSKR